MENREELDQYAREKIHAYVCALISEGRLIHSREIFDEACRMFTLINTLIQNEVMEAK